MIKHSKYKNTGILFELLVRQATSDLMSNTDPKAVKIFKKYFTDTELGKEYNLYSTVLNAPKLNENKAEILVSTITEQAKKLDRVKLDKEKYNLIKEIKKHYDLDNFFKAKIETYKIYASIYTLIENQISKEFSDTKQLITNKLTLLEHITKESLTERKVASKVVEEFMKEDKEIRVLAYKILVEKFNDKYSGLSENQKDLLKEYINNISDTKKLRTYLNTKLLEVKTEITGLKSTTKDRVLQIKLNEVLNFIKPMNPNESIKDEVLIGLMQYYQLISELKATK
tara:strand:+ start:2223 stop:3074 length:852 start_codon:yes stop_codon:yes gene_type:complete